MKQNLRFGLKSISFNIVTLYILDSMLMGLFFCKKKEIIDFEESKFSERFGECSVFLHQISKDPIVI